MGVHAALPRLQSSGPGDLLFDRFEVVEELGAGGYGRVLLCLDRESGETVALKELRRFEPDALVRFKKEFRVLADIRHPNVVRLHELVEGDRRWGFTLEYVPGHEPIGWVRTTADERGFDEGRVRSFLRGLLHGLGAIHGLGLLHRDVKPANVRVTPDGRVVLLDFGLATHLEGGLQTAQREIVGTARYMAPEAAEGAKLSPAADLYSVGVLLYEALTGSVPFDGMPVQILYAKAVSQPRRPSELVPGIPDDLDTLCTSLLATRPAERPTTAAALASLDGHSREAAITALSADAQGDAFVGRHPELEALAAYHARVAQEGFHLVLVEGESGLGKSELVQRFAKRLVTDDPGALVLSGRCHAAEQVGFKAFDGVVDALASHLSGLDHRAATALVPPDAQRLTVLFPVLAGVRAIARAPTVTHVASGERFPHFEAFRELLARIALGRRVVLVIDDLQWADQASLTLLRFFLDTPRAPRLLVLGTVRPLEQLDDAIGQGLRTLAGRPGTIRLPLAPLSAGDARALVESLAGAAPEDGFVDQVAAASGGHPLFVRELLRHGRGAVTSDLDAAIEARIATLEPDHRTALELACVAGGPLPTRVFRAALRERGDALTDTLSALRIERLLRAARKGESIVYHDRIRDAVMHGLGAAARAAHHRALAEAWESSPDAEPARLAMHFLGCDEFTRAAPFLLHAAEQAARRAAFEEAAGHYATLLGLTDPPRTADENRRLSIALSEALASAGRCADSARILLKALEAATPEEAPDLAIRAAQRLLQAANLEEGLAAVESALGSLGVAWPVSDAAVVWRLVWNRVAISLRSFEVREPSRPLRPEERTELEALRRLTLPLAWADLFRCAEVTSRHARLALATGDPDHVSYALSGEAGMRALQGGSPEQVTQMFATAEAWRASKQDDELHAFHCLHLGGSALWAGDVRGSRHWLAQSEETYRTRCPAARWELSNARAALLAAHHQLGDFRLHGERAQEWIDEARVRDDRFAEATYSATGLGCWRHLYVDAPDRAHGELARVMAPWRTSTIGIQNFAEAIASGWVHAYAGGSDAAAYWEERWPALTRSFLSRLPWMRDALFVARIGTIVARTRADGLARADRREAATLLRRLRNARSAYGLGYGALFDAQLAFLEGDLSRATERATVAYAHCERMGYYGTYHADVLVARASRAPDARDREARALDWLAGQGFVDPGKAFAWWLPVARTWR